MLGLMRWIFFSNSAIGSTGSIVSSAHLIRKVHFPRETLPIATVLFNFAQLLLALSAVLPVMVVVFQVKLAWTAFLFLPLLLLHMLFTIGIALFLSAVTTKFRDVAHFTEVAMMVLFWTALILYAPEMAPSALRMTFKVNPLAAFTMAYHDVLYWGRVPSASVMVSMASWTVLALLVGHAVFRSYSPRFAEAV